MATDRGFVQPADRNGRCCSNPHFVEGGGSRLLSVEAATEIRFPITGERT